MPAGTDGKKASAVDCRPHLRDTGRRRYRRWSEEDAKRWKESFEGGRPILEIAAADQVDPKLVSQRLHRLGVEIYQGRHRVEQLPLKIPNELAEILSHGPDHVLKFIDERVWGLTATESGIEQLRKFCRFIDLHKQGTGVLEIASQLQVHRTTVKQWREFTDRPYLVATAHAALSNPTTSDEKLLASTLGFRRQHPNRLDSDSHPNTRFQRHPEDRNQAHSSPAGLRTRQSVCTR